MALDIEKLVRIGGKEWQKGELHRVYFDDLPTWYGLDCSFYNTGNVQSARVDGQTVSNAEGRRIFARLACKKFWYDVTDKQYHGSAGMTQADFEVIREKVRAAYHAL